MAKTVQQLDNQLNRGAPRSCANLAAAVPLILVAFLVLTSPGAVPGRVVNLRIAVGRNTNGAPLLTVTVSNASPDVVIYENGPLIDVACLRNGFWQTNTTGRSFTGQEILKPGAVRAPADITTAVTPGTQAVRAGLTVTSFSWRSRLAWRLPRNRLLNPLAAWLFAQDSRKRSQTDWSDVVNLGPTQEMQPVSKSQAAGGAKP